MSSLHVRRQRRMLRSWLKWIPVVAIPFGVLFTHAWLNIQILRADYALQELDVESKRLHEELRRATVEQTLHQAPDLLAAQADEMAFVSPKPGQREVIYFDPADFTVIPEERGFAMAQRMPLPAERDRQPMPVLDGLAKPAPATTSEPAAASVPEVVESAVVDEAVVVRDVELSAPAPAPEPEPAPEPAPAPAVTVAPEVVVETPIAVAPVQEAPSVVLDMPEDLYNEALPDIESDMGGLETL